MTPTSALPDRSALRARFPALAGPTAFLENAGGSQLPAEVPDAMHRYMRETYVQLGAGYPASRAATELVHQAHEFGARLVNGRDGHVILGPSTTVLVRMLAACCGSVLKPGAEIVVAETGHEANVGPWVELEHRGAVIRWWRADPERRDCRIEDLDPLLNGKTALVVLPHVSNLLGAVADVAEVTRRAHAAGARVVVDGVAYAPHRPVDVAAWGVDWYVYSTYKVFGPHMALMYGRTDAFEELTGPNHFFIGKSEIPYKFEPGGVNHEGCAGLLALQPYLAFLAGADESRPASREVIVRAFETMAALELPLQERLVGWLKGRAGVTIVGPATHGPERVPTISFLHDRLAPPEITRATDAAGIAIRHGHMYAYRLCRAIGVPPEPGVVRVSLLHYNTPGEVDRLTACLGMLFDGA